MEVLRGGIRVNEMGVYIGQPGMSYELSTLNWLLGGGWLQVPQVQAGMLSF